MLRLLFEYNWTDREDLQEDEIWFQQDGATAYIATQWMEVLQVIWNDLLVPLIQPLAISFCGATLNLLKILCGNLKAVQDII